MNTELSIGSTRITDLEMGTTIINLEVQGFDGRLLASEAGASKCMSEDNYSHELGDALALARALQKVGKALEKEAFKEVHKRDLDRTRALEATRELKQRSTEARYRWLCEFAELINLKLASESVLDENDIVPEPVKKGKKKARSKAFQIRKDLPA